METSQPSIIAIVGMTGSGKSEAGIFFKEKGYSVIRLGAVVDDEIEKAGLTWSPENTAYFRGKIRKELGMVGIATLILPKIRKELETNKNIILDGLYSWEEYLFLKEQFPTLTLLCIYTRTDIRYQRLLERVERPFQPHEARERDINEIEVTNKGGPIALADYLITNEETKEALYVKLEEFYLWIQQK